MKHYANYFLTTGRIAQFYSLPEGLEPFRIDGTAVIELDEVPLDAPSLKVVDGLITSSPIPPQPSHMHMWDSVKEEWFSPLDYAWKKVRQMRDEKIAETDWTQLSDVPEATRQRYVEYRQALRDVTKQPDPRNIVWPTPPN